jgi:hypothetical protein
VLPRIRPSYGVRLSASRILCHGGLGFSASGFVIGGIAIDGSRLTRSTRGSHDDRHDDDGDDGGPAADVD